MLGNIFVIGLVLFVGFVLFCVYASEVYDPNASFAQNMEVLLVALFIIFVLAPWFFGLPIFKIIFG